MTQAAPWEALARAFVDRSAVLGVIGLGYVGLPLSMAAVRCGFRVIGFDTNPARVDALRAADSPIGFAHVGALRAAIDEDRFDPTSDLTRLGEPDVLIICVPTPLGSHREPDLQYVEGTSMQIARCLRPGQLIVLESTTFPGTTRERVKPVLERTGLRSGEQFLLAYSPEREDPGNRSFDTTSIAKLVGGDGEDALSLTVKLYGQIVDDVVPVSSMEVAEAAKLTENIFRAVNIALANELKLVLTRMDIDVHEVIDAAKTKPFGYMPFYPGPGLGGHCIPIDPFYLTWRAHEFGVRTRFIELAGEINTMMPEWVVERSLEALDRHRGKGLNGARVLVLGVAYKRNVDDVRESPALVIIDRLDARGADVAFHDPHVRAIPPTREHGRLAGRKSEPLNATILAAADLVVVVTDHDAIDWSLVAAHAQLVVDTRDVMRRHNLTGPIIVQA